MTSTTQRLPSSFQPHNYTVIIGKGKLPQQASGNRRLKVIVQSHMSRYADCNAINAKVSKSKLVSQVFNIIREACHPHPEAAFVKFDGQHWWQATDKTARDKIAATFRDCLHSQYKSSTKNKVAKRRARRAEEKLSDGDNKDNTATTTPGETDMRSKQCTVRSICIVVPPRPEDDDDVQSLTSSTTSSTVPTTMLYEERYEESTPTGVQSSSASILSPSSLSPLPSQVHLVGSEESIHDQNEDNQHTSMSPQMGSILSYKSLLQAPLGTIDDVDVTMIADDHSIICPPVTSVLMGADRCDIPTSAVEDDGLIDVDTLTVVSADDERR